MKVIIELGIVLIIVLAILLIINILGAAFKKGKVSILAPLRLREDYLKL